MSTIYSDNYKNEDTAHSFFTPCGDFNCDEDLRLVQYRLTDSWKPPFGILNGRIMLTLEIPDGITAIGTASETGEWTPSLFRDMTILKRLVLPSDLKSIGFCEFSGCAIMELTLPASLRYLGGASFMHCYIDVLRIPADFPEPCYKTDEPDGCLRCFGRARTTICLRWKP